MPRRIRRDVSEGFGRRLATMRKQAGITQTALAAEIGVSQRMMNYYEGPTAHPPAALLPAIARALGVSVDALLGTETAKRKAKAVDTRMQRRLQQIANLSPEERREILQFVDAFIGRGQLNARWRAAPRSGYASMTTVQINLPDELARDAQAAGLLTPEALEQMLREQLRKRAGEQLRGLWARRPTEQLTPETEQEIVAEVRAVRAERRKRGAS